MAAPLKNSNDNLRDLKDEVRALGKALEQKCKKRQYYNISNNEIENILNNYAVPLWNMVNTGIIHKDKNRSDKNKILSAINEVILACNDVLTQRKNKEYRNNYLALDSLPSLIEDVLQVV